jgi:hypothetical protein
MTKYLVFKLESLFEDQHTIQDGKFITVDVLQPCFELINEFEDVNMEQAGRFAKGFAESYSLAEKVRTLVVKGEVFGD